MRAKALLALPVMGVIMEMITYGRWRGGSRSFLLPARDGGRGDRTAREEMECVPCDVLFSQLKPNEWGGRDQDVEMQLRGEVW